ncbi:unnamed protein product [Phytophthora lilii]|uniref:Unnamed protein product n=1 Tax=Phytophthora lilii TaxID=2077276 RepID=A0A9W6TCL6_9STRA|nr:unnamed protein product [Phytophthora lilii]
MDMNHSIGALTSLPFAVSHPRARTMSSTSATLVFHVLLVGNVLLFFDALNLGILFLVVSLALAYSLLFVGLCYAATFFTTSFVFAPYIAIKLQLKLASVVASYAVRGFEPIFPEWTFIFEITISMTRYVLAEYGQTLVIENAQKLRIPVERYGKTLLKTSFEKHDAVPITLYANGMEHVWLRDAKKQKHHVIVVHFHGGGYCLSDPLLNIELGNQTRAKLKKILEKQYSLNVSIDVLLARYRMAPEFLYPTALNDCLTVYKHVLKYENVLSDHVLLSGDSAGAEMAITNCMRLRNENPELQPAAVLCYSPVVDFSEAGDDEKSPHCILTNSFISNCIPMYLQNVTDPEERRLVSPINNCLQNLPPIFLQWGELELFYQQGLRFMEKADAEGVTNMEFEFLANMVHNVVMLPSAVSPLAERGIQNGCAFAAKHLAPALHAKSGPDPASEPKVATSA